MKEFKIIDAEHIYAEGTTMLPDNHSIVECDCCKVKMYVPTEEISENIIFICSKCNSNEELAKLKDASNPEQDVINKALGN